MAERQFKGRSQLQDDSLTHLRSAAGLTVVDAAPGLRDTYQKTMRKPLIWASVAKKYQISVIDRKGALKKSGFLTVC